MSNQSDTPYTNHLDEVTLRRTYGCFPSGVVAVAAVADGEPVGMAASSFASVSLDPPLVSVCVANSSRTWAVLRTLPRIGVSVFADGHEDACRQMATKDADRFAGLPWESTPDDAVHSAGAAAWLDCSVQDELPAGDHHIVLLRVHGLQAFPETAPLVFHGSRFHRLAA